MSDSVNFAVTIFDSDSDHGAFEYRAMSVNYDKRFISETVIVDNQLIGITVCFVVILMVMVVVFCYNINKTKNRMRGNNQKRDDKDLSETVQESSETSSFVFNLNMTKI